MKLFKNKVGRPSNEIKIIRKIYIISIIALLTSTISLIISGLLLNKNVGENLYARTKKSNNITININPLNGEKSGGTSTKVSGGLFSHDYYTWKSPGDKYVDYTIENNGNNDVWYRWFIYKKSEHKDNLTYDKTASERGCKMISSGKTATDEEKKKMTLASSGNSSTRIAKIKVYESLAACENDNNATASALNEVTIKYQYASNNSNYSSKENSGAMAKLKALIEWIISLFINKDIPGTGSGKETTLTPPVKTSLKMTSTSGIKHDIAVDCNTKVYAPFSGTATYKTKHKNGKIAGYGNVIEITSSDGVYEVKLAHLNSFVDYKVEYGYDQTGKSCADGSCSTRIYGEKSVKQGDYIGKTGSSGNSTGCHLHIELKKNGKRVDPSTYFGY